MKKISALILCLIVLWSCSSDTPKENVAPTAPGLSYPTNNLVCIGNIVTFQWTASTDEDGDPITYRVEVATNNTFTENLTTSTTTSLSRQITLFKGKLYYWRVKATDNENASSPYSGVNSFYTEGEGVVNHVPFAPVLSSPLLNSAETNSSVSLNWTASDADAADVLTYDVYFGTTNPPTDKVASDITANSYTATANTAGDYYWKVVVKDGKGGTTVGQVWNFTKE